MVNFAIPEPLVRLRTAVVKSIRRNARDPKGELLFRIESFYVASWRYVEQSYWLRSLLPIRAYISATELNSTRLDR